jgi:luciferase family oxidoreductase group 1
MPGMIPFSVLDLSPIPEGSDAGQALRNSADLARHAEDLGYNRFWMAEHHNMPGIASAATAVSLAHVANGTKRIRIGAGGIMLPNHAPLTVAEQFGTLAALYPGRIDLGLGRAPGTDQVTSHALRRTLQGDVDSFPQDVMELMAYFRPAQPGQRVQAVPGAGLDVPVWILGSSTYGAQLAAALGLPYAFASHFAPTSLHDAIAIYRERFRPAVHLLLAPAVLREPAQRPSGQAARAEGGLLREPGSLCARDDRQLPRLHHRRRAGCGAARVARHHRAHWGG